MMIDINLLPPALHKNQRPHPAKALVFLLVFLLAVAVGVGVAFYTYRVIPDLTAERDQLLQTGLNVGGEARRVEVARELYSRRIVWSGVLGAIKSAAAVNLLEMHKGIWLSRIAASAGAVGIDGSAATTSDRGTAEELVTRFPSALTASGIIRSATLARSSWENVPATAAAVPGRPGSEYQFSLEAVVR